MKYPSIPPTSSFAQLLIKFFCFVSIRIFFIFQLTIQEKNDNKKTRKEEQINYKRSFFLLSRRRLHHVVLMALHSTTRHLVNKLEAAGVLVCREAFQAAEAGAARCASVAWWKAADGTEMSFRKLRGWRLSACIVGSIGIHLSVFFEQLHEGFPVLDAIVVCAAWFLAFASAARCLEVIVKLGYFLWHHQVGVGIIMKVILLERFESLFSASLTSYIIDHALLIRVFDSARLTCCHHFCFCSLVAMIN